jgi:S1-C subfamily serine protease
MSEANDAINVPVAAPIDTDSAGRGGDVAIQSVFRVICQATNSQGTGFLHKSGNIITAEHVVRGCAQPTIFLASGSMIFCNTLASDNERDISVLKPAVTITGTPLSISSREDFTVGTQVSTWGFPGGYFGVSPMLSVGYLSGIDGIRTASGTVIRQWVVNAAFNSGNSGGPLLHIETGEVIGVVSSKLAPITQETAAILTALETQNSGFTYNATLPNGTTTTFTEGQLIGKVLNELRRQVQLVIGKAVLTGDLRNFLISQKIDP